MKIFKKRQNVEIGLSVSMIVTLIGIGLLLIDNLIGGAMDLYWLYFPMMFLGYISIFVFGNTLDKMNRKQVSK